jgi:hypothetical protein
VPFEEVNTLGGEFELDEIAPAVVAAPAPAAVAVEEEVVVGADAAIKEKAPKAKGEVKEK